MFTTKENESVVPNHKIAKTQTMIARGNSIILFFLLPATNACLEKIDGDYFPLDMIRV